MLSWHKLPRELQRAILAMVLLSGEAAATSCCSPMVCDPPPPPAVTPTPRPSASPIICDPAPPPATATPTPTSTPTPTPSATPSQPPAKTPMIFDPPPNPPPAPEGRMQDARAASPSLPLAEIRSVSIYWDDSTADGDGGLAFEAVSPWPGARYRWSASGGTLDVAGERATWQPPDGAGRYLLQVVADWGAVGLAVDALVLVVGADGSVTVG